MPLGPRQSFGQRLADRRPSLRVRQREHRPTLPPRIIQLDYSNIHNLVREWKSLVIEQLLLTAITSQDPLFLQLFNLVTLMSAMLEEKLRCPLHIAVASHDLGIMLIRTIHIGADQHRRGEASIEHHLDHFYHDGVHDRRP